MSQYMIIRGTVRFDGKENDPSLAVAVKAVGDSLEITGSKSAVDYYSRLLNTSQVIAQSFVDGELVLSSYKATNSMMDIAVFDSTTYDQFKDEYEKIKGTKRVLKITRVPHWNDEDFSPDKVKAFYRRARKIRDQARK